ncbi:hypothetical protein J4Q44_G00164350 [Coregonus suidteri]|uniref:Uncharacterized protein n=1 Tax=Coregonus suidteri TaxID=861788 RepID=A0AAN8LLE2_9TELE
MKKDEKVRAFNTNWYQKYSWLTGSLSSSRLYFWPCLLFGKSEPWSKGGYSDLKNIDRSAKQKQGAYKCPHQIHASGKKLHRL